MSGFTVRQTAALVDGRPFDLRRVRPAQVAEVRELADTGRLICPSCREPLRVAIDASGVQGGHEGGAHHEPEDLVARLSKEMLHQRLARLFPSAVVEEDVELGKPDRLADIVLVRDNGGRLAIEFQGSDFPKGKLGPLLQGYEQSALRALWILDSRRLKVTSIKGQVATVNVGRLEVDLLRAGEPLLYLEPNRRQILRLLIPGAAQQLLRHESVASLGRLPCLMRRYRLAQLRIREGRWFIDADYDLPLPKPPPLPKRLQRKLEKLQPQAS